MDCGAGKNKAVEIACGDSVMCSAKKGETTGVATITCNWNPRIGEDGTIISDVRTS